jgi:hypothetical protein
MTDAQKPPLCRYCGKPIGKRSRMIKFVLDAKPYSNPLSEHDPIIMEVEKYPQNLAAVRKLCNGDVLTVVYHRDGVSSAFVWDRISYKDLYFCSGDHAKRFGYAAALAGFAMPKHTAAIAARSETT